MIFEAAGIMHIDIIMITVRFVMPLSFQLELLCWNLMSKQSNFVGIHASCQHMMCSHLIYQHLIW